MLSYIVLTDFVGLDAVFTVHPDFQSRRIMFYLNVGRSAQISVGIVAVPKCQSFNVMMALKVRGPIIQETSYAAPLAQSISRALLSPNPKTYLTTRLIDQYNHSIKFAHGVDTCGPNFTLFFRVPHLYISARVINARRTKPEIRRPLGLRSVLVGP